MAFVPKTWTDRIAQFANRRKLTNVTTGDQETVTVAREEGEVTQEGDAFSAANMNDLETRIDNALTELQTIVDNIPRITVDSALSSSSNNPVRNSTINSALNGKANSSHTHGNIQNNGALQTSDVAIANGDKLVVTDASNSARVACTSLTFDGSTTSQYLSKKGTWQSIPNRFPKITTTQAYSFESTGNWSFTNSQYDIVFVYFHACDVLIDGNRIVNNNQDGNVQTGTAYLVKGQTISGSGYSDWSFHVKARVVSF